MKKISFYLFCLLLLTAWSWSFSFAHEDKGIIMSRGQTVYVGAYSHIYAGNRELPLLLTVTLSIRNIDPKNSITITSVNYYGQNGELIKKILEQSVKLGPLGSVRYIIPQKDKAGGSGANFLVKWKTDQFVNPPLVESIMIGAAGQQGISFTSRGQAIADPN